MRKTATLISLLILFITVTPITSADTERWILKYSVEDLETKHLVLERDFESGESNFYTPVFAGAEYNITLTINIPMSVPYVNLTLKTWIEHSSILDRYWEKHFSSPPTIIGEDYNPNSRSLRIRQEKRTIVVSLYGRIPEGITKNKISDAIILHRPANFIVIELLGPNQQRLDNVTIEVIDPEIFEYRNLLKEKEGLLQNLKESSPKVAPAYINLFEDVILRAKYEADQGFVDNAISLLNILTPDSVPREHAPSIFEEFFFPIVGGVGVIAAIFGALFLRARGKTNYLLMVIEDQIRELEGLTFRASKIDKRIHSSLEEVKDRLKKLIEE